MTYKNIGQKVCPTDNTQRGKNQILLLYKVVGLENKALHVRIQEKN